VIKKTTIIQESDISRLCLEMMIQLFLFWRVKMQCPDPHFKKRHQKRRVVQKPLVNSILQNLKPGGKVSVLLNS